MMAKIPGTSVFPVEGFNDADSLSHTRKDATSRFLDSLPTSNQAWMEKKSDSRFSTAERLSRVFDTLTLSSSQNAAQPVGSTSQLIKDYLALQDDAEGRLKTYCFVLLLCVCVVALKSGKISLHKVEEILQAKLGVTPAYLSRLRRVGRCIAYVIDVLEEKMGTAGSHLFILYGHSIETYRQWTNRAATAEFVIEEVNRRCKSIVQPRPEPSVDLSFAPAFLVSCIGKWSLEEVNDALGTTLSQAEYDRNLQTVMAMKPGFDSNIPTPIKVYHMGIECPALSLSTGPVLETLHSEASGTLSTMPPKADAFWGSDATFNSPGEGTLESQAPEDDRLRGQMAGDSLPGGQMGSIESALVQAESMCGGFDFI